MSLLWYASYGSNLDPARFDVYLRGGAFDGNTHVHPGARDPQAPRDDTWLSFPGQVVFAEYAAQWAGAVAFYAPDGPGRAWFRCYLITEDQFDDVVAQECGQQVGAEAYARQLRGHGRRWERGRGWYETLLTLGTDDGVDVVTFTAADVEALTLAPPSEAYLGTLARGLRQAPDVDVVDYLAACPGVAGFWTRDDVARVVATS